MFDCSYVSMPVNCQRPISWCLTGPWRDVIASLKVTPSSFLNISSEIVVTSALVSILNWTGFPFNSNSAIHWLSLLWVDISSIVPRKDSSLTVSVHIVAKFVTDLHTD